MIKSANEYYAETIEAYIKRQDALARKYNRKLYGCEDGSE